MTTFRIGQKVTPKTSEPWDHEGDGDSYPQFGVVYTVRAADWEEDGQYIWLGEIINEPKQYSDCFGEQNFYSDDFAAVVERKTDISVFTKILRKATKPARTPAMSQQDRA